VTWAAGFWWRTSAAANVKILATGETERRKIPSGSEMTPERMVQSIKERTSDWEYDVVSIGYPGPVRGGEACGGS